MASSLLKRGSANFGKKREAADQGLLHPKREYIATPKVTSPANPRFQMGHAPRRGK